MNKKIFKGMSTAAIAAILSATMITPAFAKVDGYLVKDENGNYIQYSYDELVKESQDSLGGEKALLFEDYLKNNKNIVGYHDDVLNEYVNIENIRNAASDALGNNEPFDIHDFTKNAKPEEIVKGIDKAKVQQRTIGKDGTIVNKPLETPVEKVEVKEVSSITKTEVTVKLTDAVKEATADKFQVKANGTDVKVEKAEKVEADLTGKTYKLTVATLANKEGKLAVNGVEKDFDFKAPEVTSIVAKGTKAVEITFNEKLDPAAANIAIGNFTVVKPGAVAIVTSSATLDTTGTKVLLVLNTDMTVADYALKLGAAGSVDVKDVAGNGIYNGTEVAFRPTADQLKVEEAASITTAEYNNGNGELVLTFNKNVAHGDVNLSKLTIGGVVIPSDSVKAQAGNNGVKITLAGDTKKAIDAISGEISLVGAKDAWKDAEFATEGQTIVVTKVSPAVIKSAAYNQETKVLTVNFDQPVKDLVLANIKVNDSQVAKEATADGATNPDGTALDTAKAKATWELKLADDQAKNLEDEANNKKELKVYMDAAAVKNDNDKKVIKNVATTYTNGGVEVKYSADETKPYLVKAEYFNQLGNNDKNVLKLTFNEALDNASIDVNHMRKERAVKIATSANGDIVDLHSVANENIKLDATGKILTVKFADQEGKKVDTQYLSQKPIKVWFDKEALQDKNGLNSEATTFENGMEVTYKDFIAPGVDNVDSLNEEYVKVEFNEPLDKASAEDIKNYIITDERDQKLNILTAQVQSDRKTVYLKTEKQEFGRPYILSVDNIRDTQLNSIHYGGSGHNFYGKDNKLEGNLKLESVTVDAPSNSNNDTLEVTFTEPVNQSEALNLVNYAVLESGTLKAGAADWTANDVKAVSLEDAKAEIDATGKVVTITLGKANLQNDKFYRVAVSNMKDVYGNSLTGETTVDSVALVVDGNLAKPTVVEGNTKENAVKLTFKEELNKTESEKVTNYKINGNEITKAVYSWDAEKKEATVTLDVKTALEDSVNILVHKNVTNLAGKGMATYDVENNMATINAPATLIDIVAPSIDKVEAQNPEGSNNDVISVKFKDKDILNVEANYGVTKFALVDTTTGKTIDLSKTAKIELNENKDTITLKFDEMFGKMTNPINLQSDHVYTLTVKDIMDKSGNKLAEVTKNVTWATGANHDVTAPKIADNGINVTAGVPGTGTVVVTLSEVVDKASAETAANYTIETSADGITWNKLTPIMATLGADNKVTVRVSETLAAAAHNNQYRVTVKNVKDLAGNVQVDGASQVNAPAAPVASISNLSTQALTEAAANDGTLTNGVIDVTIQNGTFAADIAKADVVPANLPAGMDYTVVRTDDTHLKITVTGTANAHANTNDVNNLTFTIAQAKVTGASAALVTDAISIDFKDAAALTVGSATIAEATGNDGSITATQVVTLTNGTFAAGIAKANVTINNLPSGLDYTVTRDSDTQITISFTGKATSHAAANNVNNASVQVVQAQITGATADVTSDNFAINFND